MEISPSSLKEIGGKQRFGMPAAKVIQAGQHNINASGLVDAGPSKPGN